VEKGRIVSISVVIPTFNREMLLRRAISSALEQTLPIKELIVVDDGSTDRTQELLSDIASIDPRVKVLMRQRGGANRARNAGANLAEGDWIAFLDSDDFWEQNKLDLQVQALQKNPAAVASFTGLKRIGHDAGKVFLPPAHPSLLDLRAANVLSTTSSAVVKASVFHEVGGFDADLPSCQDWDLWFRLRLKGEFAVVREPLVIYDAGPHARISSDLSKVIAGHNIVFERVLQGIDREDPSYGYITARHKLVLSEMYLRNGEFRTALEQVVSSIRSKPSRWGARLLAAAMKNYLSSWISRPPKRLPL
jgi:glycosyltransferase involved in cell wall biosynthesis